MIGAGFAKVEITPPPGVELAGFGPFLRRRATATRSPIWARAVAVDDGDRRWVLASCDLLGVDAATVEAVVDRVAGEHSLPRAGICVHATHNHSGPGTLPDFIGWGQVDGLYYALLADRIAAACIRAIDALRVVSVSVASAPLPGFAYNRVLSDPPALDTAIEAGVVAPEHPDAVDANVEVVRFDDDSGLAGLLAYYSCHPVICCEQTSEIHGDFAGEAMARLEQERPGATAVFLQGSMGDIDPIYAHGTEPQSYRALDLFSARFAGAVAAGLDAAIPLKPGSVAAHQAAVGYTLSDVPAQRLADELDRWRSVRRRADEAGDADGAAHASVYTQSYERSLRTLAAGHPIKRAVTAHALRLGELTLTGLNLELFHGLKRAHQAEFGPRALLLSTTDGYLGYGPTRAAFSAPRGQYATQLVPLYLGHLPFTERIEDELLAGARSVVDTTLARKSKEHPA